MTTSLQGYTNAPHSVLTPGNVSTGFKHCDFDVPAIFVDLRKHLADRVNHLFVLKGIKELSTYTLRQRSLADILYGLFASFISRTECTITSPSLKTNFSIVYRQLLESRVQIRLHLKVLREEEQ